MINLRFRPRVLPFNSKGQRKVECVYHWRTTSHLPPLTDIKWGLRPGYEYFRGGSFEIQKDVLAPDFYLNCFLLSFFLLFNKIILLLILLTQTRQFRFLFFFFFLLWKNCIHRRPCIWGGKLPVPVLIFNSSRITRLVSLKCGSARALVMSVTLNSVQQTTPNVCGGRWRERTAPSKPAGHMAV